ncbi:MAG: methyltransferase domain-containing protein [Gammaproteobacteria bacterium]|nr:methyltransferase domain-containing protein [Gammaproteobacteria bacterium]
MNADSSDICQQLECWFENPAGQYLLRRERELVAKLLEQVFGYHLLQLGITRQHGLALDSALNHKIYAAATPAADIGLVTQADSLPFANDSIDVAVLHHSIDFAENPHQLLREVQRVVAAQGHIIILGFNPWSVFGLGATLRGLYPGSFWGQAAPMSVRRLRDWLHLLGSEVRAVGYTFATPPVGQGRAYRWLARCDSFVTRHNWPLGGAYVLHAQKQVVPLTPTRLRWESSVGNRLMGLGVAKPVPSPRGVEVAA